MRYTIKDKRELPAVDLVKFVCAICVVYLHVPAFLSLSEEINYFITLPCKIAVPFFFLASAYFLFEKINRCKDINEEEKIMKSYCRKIGIIWLRWSGLYLICRILDIIQRSGKDILDIKILLYYIRELIQDFIFGGIGEHLWYLPATLIGTFIVYKIRKNISKVFGFTIVIGLFLIGLLGNTYNFLLPESMQNIYNTIMSIILTTRSGIFWAPIFILIGSYIADKGINTFQHNKQVVILICSILGLILEGIWIFKNHENYTYLDLMISPVFLTTALFLLLCHVEVRMSNMQAKRMRQMSLSIYLIHPMILSVCKWIAEVFGWKDLYQASGWYFIVVLTISVLLGYLMSIKRQKVAV